MTCFCTRSCKTSCSAFFVSFFSVLILLTSLLCVFLSTRLHISHLWALLQISDNQIDKAKTGIFYGVLALILTSIIASFLGFMASKIKSCCYVSTFAIVSVLSFLAYLIIGGVMLSSTFAAVDQVNSYCT